MSALINKLIKRKCITVKDSDKISELVKKLKLYNIGAVPVVDKNFNLTGIVSERDIIKNLLIHRSSLLSEVIFKIKIKEVITCNVNASSKELMEIMSFNKIRHIPITNDKKLLGIVSIGDVVNRLIEIYTEETTYLKQYIAS